MAQKIDIVSDKNGKVRVVVSEAGRVKRQTGPLDPSDAVVEARRMEYETKSGGAGVPILGLLFMYAILTITGYFVMRWDWTTIGTVLLFVTPLYLFLYTFNR